MFNKESFSNILKKINNEYPSMTEFAKKATLDRSYISKYINQKLSNPPTPKILFGIATASKGITTYEELMNICGYIPLEMKNTYQSLDIQLAESIFNNRINLLDRYKLLEDDISFLKEILVKRQEINSSIKFQLNDFSNNHSTNPKELYAALIHINDEINEALINLHKNGYLYPIPVYKNTKNIDLFLVSDIVDYINCNILATQSANDYFALLINTDKMAPLLDIGDVAIIHKQNNLDNGAIVASYSITQECCIIGKLFKYDNIIEFSYLNSKSEKFIDSDIKFLGKVIKAEVNSAFK